MRPQTASPTRSRGCCRARRFAIARPACVAPAQPADIAILFRSRDSHRDFESALEAAACPTYVYKGLGFFDADEIQDAVALLRYLADPPSDLRAAAFLRSRIVRLSDDAVAPIWRRDLADALARRARCRADAARLRLTDEDRACLSALRAAVPRWLSLVDRMPPADLLDRVLAETAYAYETARAARLQARENLKKLRGWSGAFRTAATRRSAASPSISTASRWATNRTRRSTPSTPST